MCVGFSHAQHAELPNAPSLLWNIGKTFVLEGLARCAPGVETLTPRVRVSRVSVAGACMRVADEGWRCKGHSRFSDARSLIFGP